MAVPIRPRYSDPLEFENYEQQRFNWYMENLAPTVQIDTNKIIGGAVQGAIIGAALGAISGNPIWGGWVDHLWEEQLARCFQNHCMVMEQ